MFWVFSFVDWVCWIMKTCGFLVAVDLMIVLDHGSSDVSSFPLYWPGFLFRIINLHIFIGFPFPVYEFEGFFPSFLLWLLMALVHVLLLLFLLFIVWIFRTYGLMFLIFCCLDFCGCCSWVLSEISVNSFILWGRVEFFIGNGWWI